MPGNVTDVDTFTSPIVHPTDGDAVNGAGLLTLAQGVSNRTRYLYNRLAGNRTVLIAPEPAASKGGYFAAGAEDPGAGVMLQTGTPGSDPMTKVFLRELPIKGRIAQVRVHVFGAWSSSTHSALPSSMPSVQLWKLNLTTGASTQVGSTATDTSGSVGVYEAAHVLTISSLTQAIEGFLFYLLIRGEDDTNALANSFAVMGIEVDVEAM